MKYKNLFKETIVNYIKMKYLMSPDLYFSLCNVRGFTDMNGDTYQKHIILILEIHYHPKPKKNNQF